MFTWLCAVLFLITTDTPLKALHPGVINVIKQLIILDIDVITLLEEGFLEADDCRTFLHY